MNSVEIIGELKKPIDQIFRNVEYALPDFNEDGRNLQEIACRYWTNIADSSFVNLDSGKHVAIRGHLDVNKKFGTILVVEQFELIN